MSLPFGHPAEETSRLDPAYPEFEKSAAAIRVAAEVAEVAAKSQARLAIVAANAANDRRLSDPEQTRGNVPNHARWRRNLQRILGSIAPRDPQSKSHAPKHRGYARRFV